MKGLLEALELKRNNAKGAEAMGFRKTPKGNLVYDFDFVPKRLIPLKWEDCKYDNCYAVEGENGERAPMLFPFQGQRYEDYGFAFGILPFEERIEGKGEVMTANAQLVAALAQLYDRNYEDIEAINNGGDDGSKDPFNPWGTDSLAEEGVTFEIPSLDDAKRYIVSKGIPKDGWRTWRSCSA